MESNINLYRILVNTSLPGHWPKSSLYRLASIKKRILRTCPDEDIGVNQLQQCIKQITKETLKTKNGKTLKTRSLNTYRSVLIRYVVETITNTRLEPWEAIQFINSLKKIENVTN